MHSGFWNLTGSFFIPEYKGGESMRITTCDQCNEILQKETNNVSYFYPTVFTITETPGSGPYTHNMIFVGEEPKNLVKHFCSEGCIGRYYNNELCECGAHKAGEH
jgi:hypothetical protein